MIEAHYLIKLLCNLSSKKFSEDITRKSEHKMTNVELATRCWKPHMKLTFKPARTETMKLKRELMGVKNDIDTDMTFFFHHTLRCM